MTAETQGSENPGGSPEVPAGGSGMVDRIKRILLEPKLEWNRIDAETATVGGIFKGWAVPLAAIGPVAGLIGALAFGYSFLGVTYRPGLTEVLATAVTQYVLALVAVFVLSLLIDALAPTFGGTKNPVQAMKVAAYSSTASWVAGIFSIVPPLVMLSILGIYSLYLLYLGLPKLMKTPDEKAVPYTASIVVAGIVLFLIIGALTLPIAGLFGAGRAPAPVGELSGTLNVPGVGTMDLGKLQDASKQAEAAAKRMETATTQPSLAPATLQALLPETLGAYKRVEVSSASAGAAGIGGSSAEARYENGDSHFALRVNDIAAVGALAAMGSALNVESSRQTATGYEKTGKVDGRMTNEKWNSQSGEGEYNVVVADRFMVEASGKVPAVEVLKGAVNAVGLSKLEAMKG